MSEVLDLTTVIFLVLAVFVFFRLRAVLGQRTGHEAPSEPFFRERSLRKDKPPVPAFPPDSQTMDMTNTAGRWPDIAPEGSPLAEGLNAVASADPSFDPSAFCEGAKAAYEMIVTAFNKGDRQTLKGLLSADVYKSFAEAIGEREERGESVQANFVSLDGVKILSATMKGSEAQIGARFESKIISAIRDKDGHVIEGNPDHIADVTDLWTFARDTKSSDPNWRLIATEDA